MRIRVIFAVAVVSLALITVLLVKFRKQVIVKDKAQPLAAVVPADPVFQKWIADQAAQVDQVHINNVAAKEEVAKTLASLTPEQADQLELAAENASATVGVRMLSIYLLVEGGLKSQPQLLNFIDAPTPKFKSEGPHSDNDMKAVQDRSLKIMAVDGALSELRTQPQSRTQILEALKAIPDPILQNYAEKQAAAPEAH